MTMKHKTQELMKGKDQPLADMLGITIAEDTDRFVELSMRISDAVAEVLHRKGWTQKDLAARLGKTPAEVSKWLSGTHNLTLRSIAKLETALGEQILSVKCPEPIAMKPPMIQGEGIEMAVAKDFPHIDDDQTFFAA